MKIYSVRPKCPVKALISFSKCLSTSIASHHTIFPMALLLFFSFFFKFSNKVLTHNCRLISVVNILSNPPTVTDSSQDPAVTQVRLISHTAYTRLPQSTRKKSWVKIKESRLRLKTFKWLCMSFSCQSSTLCFPDTSLTPNLLLYKLRGNSISITHRSVTSSAVLCCVPPWNSAFKVSFENFWYQWNY